MWQRFKNPIRFLLVTVGIVILTSFSIDATDTFRTSTSALGALVGRAVTLRCPGDMVEVSSNQTPFCIDVYEASPGHVCTVSDPHSVLETATDILMPGCMPVSVAEATPWRFVTYRQAEQLCAKAGKFLPTPLQWYQSVLGTIDTPTLCNTDSLVVAKTGAFTGCVSGFGTHDMIGNLWELVAGEVIDGTYNDVALPGEGYVTTVSDAGIPLQSSTTPSIVYGDDYVWSKASGTYALMRGGYYGGKSDAGVYSTYAATDENFSSAAIGFRCAKRL